MDRESFTAAAARHQSMVYRIALSQLGSRADAEDAMQEVFLRLYLSQKPFQSEEHLRRWLIRVTVNRCRDMLKSRWRRVPLEELADLPVFDRPEDRAVYGAVMALPEKYRTVLELFYYEDLSTAQIAQVLDIRQTTVTTRLSRARESLKTQLEEVWQDDE